MAGDVHNLADKEESPDLTAFHRLAGQLAGVHAAGGYFGFLVALRAGGDQRPRVDLTLELGEGLVGPGGGRVLIEPALGKPQRQNAPQSRPDGGDISHRAGTYGCGDVLARRE